MAEVSSTSESSFAAQVVEDSFAVDRSCDEIAGVENCLLAGGLGCGDRLRRASWATEALDARRSGLPQP